MIRWRRSLATGVAALLLACTGDGTGPVAGTLKVNLTTPNSGLDGAAVIVLSGPVAPVNMSSAAGLTVWGAPVTSAIGKVALTGTLSTGTILTLTVEDVNKVQQYSATLQQVAAASDYRLRQLAGYSLSVTK
jgi:hypothetical protein